MDELDDIVIDGIAYRAPREGQMTQRFYAAEVREGSDGQSRTWVINTESLDTYRTIIDPAGGDLTRYERNPVVLIGHDRTLVAGTAASASTANASSRPSTNRRGTWTTPRWPAGIARSTGSVRGASIGFIPLVIETIRDDQNRRYVLRHRQVDAARMVGRLIPSNPDALVEGRSSDAVAAVIREFTTALDDLRGQIASLSTPASTQAEDARSASDSAPPSNALPPPRLPVTILRPLRSEHRTTRRPPNGPTPVLLRPR